ncbi:MAG: TetR/AcrR family transcriptional regulator [Bacteroidota bacterium]|nr:TetR/AcrR family transcriptional regulator [Bacteroidota bacterium]
MTNATLPATSLEAAMPVFFNHSLAGASNSGLAAALGTTEPALLAQFPSRELLVHHAMLADIERQKREHVDMYAEFPTAVERLYGLLRLGLRDLLKMPATFYSEMQAGYPQTWEAVLDHLGTYSAPQLQQLLNDGIRAKLFRSDINIQLVTKIILEQLNMMLNPQIFPPERFSPAEVFRSIFLYYIRGICTDEGARIAAEHFARL